MGSDSVSVANGSPSYGALPLKAHNEGDITIDVVDDDCVNFKPIDVKIRALSAMAFLFAFVGGAVSVGSSSPIAMEGSSGQGQQADSSSENCYLKSGGNANAAAFLFIVFPLILCGCCCCAGHGQCCQAK